MHYSFPEALDAVLVDCSFIRRSTWLGQRKYVIKNCDATSLVFYNTSEVYTPSQEDLFANDWNIYGKGVMGKPKTFKRDKEDACARES